MPGLCICEGNDCILQSIVRQKKTPKVDVTDELFLETMQKMVGGGIRAAKFQFCAKKSNDSPLNKLFQELVFKDDGSSTISTDYDKYNPVGLQHCNTGGLHLIPEPLIPWSIELMRFIIDSYADEKIIVNRGEYIAVSLLNLRKDNSIYTLFSKIIEQMSISIDVKMLEKVHLRVAEFTFRAYTKRKNNDTFNGIKELASDKSNLAFRTIVQTGGRDVKDESDSKPSKPNNHKVMKELGLQKAQTKTVKSKEEVSTS